MNTNAHLEAALEQLRAQHDRIDNAIRALEELLGMTSSTAAATPAPRQPRAQSGQDPTSEDVGPQENGRRTKILGLLQDAPLATREVATRLSIDRKLVKMTLQRMKKVGLVRSTGTGPGTRWTVPGKTPAKEAKS